MLSKSDQKRVEFVREYIDNGGNATAAYQKIYGCSYNSANAQGPKLLQDPYVVWLYTEMKETAATAATAA